MCQFVTLVHAIKLTLSIENWQFPRGGRPVVQFLERIFRAWRNRWAVNNSQKFVPDIINLNGRKLVKQLKYEFTVQLLHPLRLN